MQQHNAMATNGLTLLIARMVDFKQTSNLRRTRQMQQFSAQFCVLYFAELFPLLRDKRRGYPVSFRARHANRDNRTHICGEHEN